MTDSSKPHVVIIGAGPSGLLLARYLQIHHVPVTVYEREVSATARSQGGTLDLHEGTGLKALRETGLLDDAKAMMRLNGEAMRILDRRGKVWFDENKGLAEGISNMGSRRPEIDRTDLRNLLSQSLEPGTIQWGYGVRECRAIDNDTYHVSFIDGQPSITTSLLVGADGTFSRVRPLLHSVKPPYSGLSMYDLMIPAAKMTPSLQSFVGSGSALVLDQGKGIIPQMNSGGKCKVYVGLVVDEAWLDENPLGETGKRESLAALFEGWPEGVHECIMASDEETVTPRRIYAYNPKLRWKSDLTGVTIMGDAAHVMSPFAGEGVNQALADALDLGQTLVSILRDPRPASSLAPFPLSLLPVSHCQPYASSASLRAPPRPQLLKALRAYEKRIMARASPFMAESKYNQEVCFGPDPARRFTNLFYWMIVSMLFQLTVEYPIRAVKNWLSD